MVGVYHFADKSIRIISLFEDVHKLCRAYISDSSPDFTVEITRQDIINERKKLSRCTEPDFSDKIADGYIEELTVYRKIAEIMPVYDTFLFHGSAVAVDGKAYIFTAKSGTGKSTHTRLWRKLLGERAVMVNDDKPMIRVDKNGAVVFGTPYNGKHRLGNNISVPLKAICIIERADENSIRRISKDEAYMDIFRQSYRPDDVSALAKTLTLLDILFEHVAFWKLSCNMELEAAELSFGSMSEL